MNKELKIALAVIAGAAIFCGITSAAVYLIAKQAISQMSTTDPKLAARIGHEIANYTLPPDYREQSGGSVLGYKTVTIGPQSGSTAGMMLTLMQYRVESDTGWEELARQMGQLQPNEDNLTDDDDLDMEIVSTQTVTIKGQPVTLKTSESSVQGGPTMRMVFGAFRGRGNTMVMIMAQGRKDTWDQAVLDSFLASIK